MSEIKEIFGVEIDEKFDIQSEFYGVVKDCFFDGTGALVVANASNLKTFILTVELLGEAKIIEHKKSILTDEESEWLSVVVKPLTKWTLEKLSGENGEECIAIGFDTCYLRFPYFKKGTLYKGIIADRKDENGKRLPYTPEELGL